MFPGHAKFVGSKKLKIDERRDLIFEKSATYSVGFGDG